MEELNVLMEAIDIVHVHGVDELRALIERLKGSLYLVSSIDKVEHKGILLQGVPAVQSRECLYGLDVLEFLVHEHGVEHGLVEAGLIFVGHNEHVVEVAGEIERELVFRDVLVAPLVQLRLGVFLSLVFHLTREGHQGVNIRDSVLLAVVLNGKEITNGMSPTAGNDHGLSPALHAL